MKHFILFFILLALVANAFAADHKATLAIRWLPTVSADQTCGITEKELNKAVRELEKSLHAKGMEVQLGKISTTAKLTQPVSGLWIGKQSLEQILNAEVTTPSGKPEDCPVMKIGTESYETIPAELIIKAGLTAAEKLQARIESKSGTRLAATK